MESDTIDLSVQGDVFLVRCAIPESAKKTIKKPLALGEMTGHSHQIIEECEMYQDTNGTLYIRTAEPLTLKHEEHKPLTINPGEWKVGIVQEYDEFEQAARKVMD